MRDFSDPTYVRAQYHDASNLNARIALHERFSVNPYGWFQWVFDHLPRASNCSVLELGCGTGRLWLENHARIPRGWTITLTDFSDGMLAEARHNLRELSHALQFEVVDAQAIPFDDQSFDVVVADHMLYHVPDRACALAEIRRVLRPNGRLYAATNGPTHLRELGAIRQRFDPRASEHGPLTNPFRLDNGADELAPWFADVRVHPYEDGLLVTEAEPLVAHLLSADESRRLADKYAELEAYVREQLAARGPLVITKELGLFEAAGRRGT